MDREYAFYTLAVRDAPDGKRFVQAATFPSDNDTGKYLNALFVSLHHSGVNVHTIAHAELGHVGLLLFFLDGVNDAVHKRKSGFPPQCEEATGCRFYFG